MEQLDELAECREFYDVRPQMRECVIAWRNSCTSLAGRQLVDLLQELKAANDKHKVYTLEELKQLYTWIGHALMLTKNN